MSVGGVVPSLIRVVAAGAPERVAELLTPGRVLEAEVISVFQERAMLSFGNGLRLEVLLKTPLLEGQRVKVQVQPPDGEHGGTAILLKLVDAVRDGGIAPLQGQTTRETAQTQALSAPVAWLPIPLPDGKAGWVQLRVTQEPPGRETRKEAEPARQIQLWWETPALGPVQVTLSAAGMDLAALFRVVTSEIRSSVESSLPDLQRSLAAAGYPEAQVACRLPLPGESVTPAQADVPALLDRRA